MIRYRGKKLHRPVHPKIFVWSHTHKAEIEYFQDFKNYLKTPLLIPRKNICGTPQELINKVLEWKKQNVCEKDGDQVWCVFDIDDFYQKDKQGLLMAIQEAGKNNVKIAYVNECFELWIILHFNKPTFPIFRGDGIKKKMQGIYKKNKLGEFKKNQKVFSVLMPFQLVAIKNAKKLLPVGYKDIDWKTVLDSNGNPSTSIHFLVEEIYSLK